MQNKYHARTLGTTYGRGKLRWHETLLEGVADLVNCDRKLPVKSVTKFKKRKQK